ncbi:MAG: hypothetical protein KDB01_17340 [Planctomycetaceae bacterium]|nr:hypothetical protein [Planctomycetaceae bacterium]
MNRRVSFLLLLMLAVVAVGCYCIDRRRDTRADLDFFGRDESPPTLPADEPADDERD